MVYTLLKPDRRCGGLYDTWHPIDNNIMQEVYIPLAIIMIVLLLIVALVCWVSYIRFKQLTKLGSKGIDKLDKYKRWSKRYNTPDTKTEDIELEKMIKKLIKDELINMIK